jgi:hypothetical protein
VAEAELDGVSMPVSAGGTAEIALAGEGVHRIRVVLGESGTYGPSGKSAKLFHGIGVLAEAQPE